MLRFIVISMEVIFKAKEEEGGGPLLEAVGIDDICFYGGAVVGRYVNSGGICYYCFITLVQRLGVNMVVLFCMTDQTKGATYSVVGCVLFHWRRRKRNRSW